MKNSYFLITFFIGVVSFSNAQYYEEENYRLKYDDDSMNASYIIDTTLWDSSFDNFDSNKGIFWIRLETTITEVQPEEPLGILIGAMSTYEAYWDGVYIGSNAQNKIIPFEDSYGSYWKKLVLPDSLTHKGRHVLSLRNAKNEEELSYHAYFVVGPFQQLIEEPLRKSMFMFLIGGAFLTAFFYFIFLFYFENKKLVYLLFSIICILFTGLIFFEYVKFIFEYPYTFQRTRLVIIEYFHIALSIFIPIFLLVLFKLPFRKTYISILILVIAIIILISRYVLDKGFDNTAEILNFSTISICIVLSGYAFYLKKMGSLLMLGIFCFVMIFTFLNPLEQSMNFISNFDVAIFISFLLIVLGMLIVLSITYRDQRKKYELSIVTSERLKNELLKKNIKPHFIMNTLTSLIDWVEESPQDGVRFIHALAEEFDVLNDISDFSLIPIGQEIKLCKKHLEIMHFRKEINYKWEEKNIDYNEIIPPAIIHTVIENGITHARPDENKEIKFALNFEKEGNNKKYSIFTFANCEKPKEKLQEGTGTKYIKARLQESYDDQWHFSSAWKDYGWLTVITIEK